MAELATHAANLIRLDADSTNRACARQPRRSRERLARGEVYRPPDLPEGRFDPFERDADEIAEFLERSCATGATLEHVLRRRVFGIGAETAQLIVEESRAGRAPGAVLYERIRALQRGETVPVVESAGDPIELAGRDEMDPEQCRLLPWEPEAPPPEPLRRSRQSDAAATAGLYHEALERRAALRGRAAGLVGLLRSEILRVESAHGKATADIESFRDPDRYKKWGEALLAGLHQARVLGDRALVPDPHDIEAAIIEVPVRPGATLQRSADEWFKRHRRARRGKEQATHRAERLAARRERLVAVAGRFDGRATTEALTVLQDKMRAEGIPVGLEQPSRRAREAAAWSRPRAEGVRVLTSSDGLQILVGKGGRENHRLTFKLAAPEDLWFHARLRTADDPNGGQGSIPHQIRILPPLLRHILRCGRVQGFEGT